MKLGIWLIKFCNCDAKIFNFGHYKKILFFKLHYFNQNIFGNILVNALAVYLFFNF